MVYKRRIRSVGALWERNGSGWLGHYISDSRKRKSAIKILHEEGEILQFYVTGINIPFYIAKEDENFFNYRENEKRPNSLHLLIICCGTGIWWRNYSILSTGGRYTLRLKRESMAIMFCRLYTETGL